MKKLILLILIIATLFMLYYLRKPETETEVIADCKVTKVEVLKAKRKLILLCGEQEFKIYSISLGPNPKGHKQFEGDNKTPEGLYTINDKNPNSAFHLNLGISYPNAADKAYAEKLGKSPGGLIKIHGLPNGQGSIGKAHLQNDWTAGCIAVTNEEIEEIYELVEIGTPIEIKK